MYRDPSPPTEASARHPDPNQPEPNCDDQLPPDPLLKSGAFIDVSRNVDAASPTMTKQDVRSSPASASTPTAVDSSVPTYVTPVSQWRPSSQPEEASERPNWLPQDWTFERKVRVSGVTAGTIDRPSSHRSSMSFFLPSNTMYGIPSSANSRLIDVNAFPLEALDRNWQNPMQSSDGYWVSTMGQMPHNAYDKWNPVQIPVESYYLRGDISGSQFPFLHPRTGIDARDLSTALVEKPKGLPEGWWVNCKTRSNGATKGRIDKYYISPDGARFRSKTEVLHFIQTGSRRKRNPKSDSSSVPHAEKSDRGAKKAKGSVKDFSNLNFDFSNPPQSATWVPNDVSKDEWTPMVGNAAVAESVTSEWNNAFARVAELEKSNGAA